MLAIFSGVELLRLYWRSVKEKETRCFVFTVLHKTWKLAFSRRSRAMTAKKCTKKAWYTCRVVYFANLNLLLLPFSLTSPSSLLKILKRTNRNGRLCSRPHDKWLSNIFSFFTISTCLSTLFTKHVQQLKWVKDLTVFTLRALMV